ncbi:MAG: YceI family protein, partial [Pseudomonadota bacterium]
QPARMLATLYRQEGTVPGDRDRLAILLEGSINRHDFGASAWPEVVGPTVALRILAYIERTE